MNKLLQRQLQKYFKDSLEEVSVDLAGLFNVISESYDHYEKDRKIMERAIELTSKEMIDLNLELNKEKEELKRANYELKTLFKNINEVFFSVNMVTYTLTQISPGCEKIYGFTTDDFFNDQGLWEKVIHTEDKDIIRQQLSELAMGKQVLNQYRIIHRNGSIRWIENTVIPTLNEAGQLIRIDGVTNDISDRKAAELDLEKLVSILEATLESTADGILVTDFNGRILKCNNKFLELWGIPPEKLNLENAEESIRFVLDQLLSPDEFISRIKELNINNEEVSCDLIYFTDGKVFERYSQPQVMNGTCVGRAWSFRDVTERTKAQNEIIASNERYSLVTKATSDVIWDWDLVTNKVVRTAENMKAILGYDADDTTANSSFWANLIHPEDLPAIHESFKTVFSDPEKVYMDSEYRVRKADGEYAFIYDKGFIVRNAEGIAIRMIGACQDISRIKQNELQLQKQARDLSISNEELEQFAYVASHDLQEPLRMVTSFLTQLSKHYGNRMDDKGRKYIEFAVDGAKRMRRIILELLEYSRAGRTEDGVEAIDLNELLNEINILYKKRIEENNGMIQYEPLPVIYGYSSPIRQVFQNLISNALKYCKADTPVRIKVVAEKLADSWRFSVSDNGIGIESEYFEKIFIIFQRLHNRDEFSGTGMGLAITKKIIESMDGKIWLSSEPGKGSTFYFTISRKYEFEQIAGQKNYNYA